MRLNSVYVFAESMGHLLLIYVYERLRCLKTQRCCMTSSKQDSRTKRNQGANNETDFRVSSVPFLNKPRTERPAKLILLH